MSTCTASRPTPAPPAPSTKAPSNRAGSKPTTSQTVGCAKPPSSSTCPHSHVQQAGGGGMTASIETIWKSFVEKGHDDVELLKLLLLTKSKEDERLTALDTLRTEQLRAANTMALHQYFYQYSAFYAAQQQQQQQAQAHTQLNRAPSPYSPTSPPPPSSSSVKASTKRPRAPSDASTGSNDSVATTSSSSSSVVAPVKKPRLAPSTKNACSKFPVPPPPPSSLRPDGSKPTHEDVMELLRKKCHANQGSSPSSSFVAPPPPATATAPSKRTPSSVSPPLRHSLLLRPALPIASPSSSVSPPPPPSLKLPQVQLPPSVPLSPVVEEQGQTGRRATTSTAGGGQGVDKLAMLLRAGELKAETD